MIEREGLVAAPGNFDVTVDRQGSNVTVAPSGEIDLATVRLVTEAIEASGEPFVQLILDLRNVSFIDTSGLRLVLELNQRAERDGFGLTIVRGSRAVQRVFEISGLEDRLPFVDEPQGAPRAGG
jgi:anti-anti-sigma factor